MSPLAARTESVDADRWCTGNVLLHCDRGDDSRLSQHARDRQIQDGQSLGQIGRRLRSFRGRSEPIATSASQSAE
jgi:hypothetical protein